MTFVWWSQTRLVRFGIFPCFQWRCSGNWAPQVSASVFLSRLGTFLIQLSFFLLNLWRDCELKSFPIAAEANHFSFRYIDLQISSFNQIPFWILIFFSNHQFQIDQVWYCDKLGERPWRHWEQTLTFLYPAPPYLGASGQLFQVFNCPRLGLRDQIKLNRILKLE